MRPLAEMSGQYSLHMCREHRRFLPPKQVAVDVSPDIIVGEEEVVPGAFPLEIPPLPPFPFVVLVNVFFVVE